MKNLIVWLNSIINKHKALKRWRRVVTVLAAIMTFVTTYALILPAITVEKNKVEDVGGMYLEQEADTNDMLEENALEPIGVSIAAEHENAVTFAYADDSMTATAVFGTNDEIPAGAELVVTPIDPESVEYTSLSSRAAELLDKEFIYDVTTCSFYDFALVLNNVDVTPKTGLVDIQIIFHDNTVEHLDDTFFAGRFARSADDSSDVKDELVSVNPDESSVIELADGIITVLSLKGNDLSETDSLVGILAGNVDEEIKAAAAETDAEIPDSEDAQEESAQADSAGTDGEEAAPKVGTLKASGSDYTVTLTYDATSEIPEGASLTVSEIAQNSKEYKKYLEETKKAMGLTEEETLPQYAARFFDIKIMVGGDEFVPESGVTVEIAYTEPLAANPETEVNAVHFHNDTTEPEVIEANVTEISSDGTSNVEFTAEAFSVYGVVYTVDFHWDVDGKTYDFSIPGGGFVSLKKMVEVLGIAKNDINKTGIFSTVLTDSEEKTASDESIKTLIMDDVTVSQVTRQFVDNIDNVEFSDTSLVWVGKAEEDITVDQLKTANGLEVQYSVDLTEEQIITINNSIVESGDWALISVCPFISEETLTVTMKNGDEFVIKVTDAAYDGTVITELDGKTGALINLANSNALQSASSESVSLTGRLPAESVTVNTNTNRISTTDSNAEISRWTFAKVPDTDNQYYISSDDGYLKINDDPNNDGVGTVSISSDPQALTIVSGTNNRIRIVHGDNNALNNIGNAASNGYGTYNRSGDNYMNAGEWFTFYELEEPVLITLHFIDSSGNELTGFSFEEIEITGSTYDVTASWVQQYLENKTYTKGRYINNGYQIYEDSGRFIDLNRFTKSGYSLSNTHRGTSVDLSSNESNAHTIIDNVLKWNSTDNTLQYWAYYTNHDKAGGYWYNAGTHPSNWTFNYSNPDGHGITNDGITDYFLIYDEVSDNSGGSGGQSGSGTDPQNLDKIKTDKDVQYNNNGTYDVSLGITGSAEHAVDNPHVNVVVVFDTSSSMVQNLEPNGTATRLERGKEAIKSFANSLLDINESSGDPDSVEVALVSFDKTARTITFDGQDWTKSKSAFSNAVGYYTGTAIDSNTLNNTGGVITPNLSQYNYLKGLNTSKGTNWAQALNNVNTLSKTDDDPTYVLFYTDGGPSQYWKLDSSGDPMFYVDGEGCYLAARDEAREAVNSGYELYGVFAYGNNNDSENDYLGKLIKYAYNDNVNVEEHRFNATNTAQVTQRLQEILNKIRKDLGYEKVTVNDGITELSSTALVNGFADDFRYKICKYNVTTDDQGNTTKSIVPGSEADVTKNNNGTLSVLFPGAAESVTLNQASYEETTDAGGTVKKEVTWKLGDNYMLEDGYTYELTFTIWPSQDAYDLIADLENKATKITDLENKVKAQLVVDVGGNVYTFNTTSELWTGDVTSQHLQDLIDNDLNDANYYLKTNTHANVDYTVVSRQNGEVVSSTPVNGEEIKDPNGKMILTKNIMTVRKDFAHAINSASPYANLIFYLMIDGKYYLRDGTTTTIKPTKENLYKPSAEDPDYYYIELPKDSTDQLDRWSGTVYIAPGLMKDNQILETGHNYSLYEIVTSGNEYEYEFTPQIIRPMNISSTSSTYLIHQDDYNKPTSSDDKYVINDATGSYTTEVGDDLSNVYYAGQGNTAELVGTNRKTSELDITKIVSDPYDLMTDAEEEEETFTYRVTLSIPDGTDPAGIVGYEYVYRPYQDNAFYLYGYHVYGDGSYAATAFESDIQRLGDNKYRGWNTLVYRDLVEWANVGGKIVSLTDDDGEILWKIPAAPVEGHDINTLYHTITYDMTLKQNEVIRFTNLPSGTLYTIQEIYANKYPADNAGGTTSGRPPISDASNIGTEGYEIAQVLHTGGTLSRTESDNDTVNGEVEMLDTRYYNQFTNRVKSNNDVRAELKVKKETAGYDFGDGGESYYRFTLRAGECTYSDDNSTGISQTPGGIVDAVLNADNIATNGVTVEYDINNVPTKVMENSVVDVFNDSRTPDLTATFGNICYTMPGLYTYTITETWAPAFIVKAPPVTLTVVVKRDGSTNKLYIEDIFDDSGTTYFTPATDTALATGLTTQTNATKPISVIKIDSETNAQMSGAEFEICQGYERLYIDSANQVLTTNQLIDRVNAYRAENEWIHNLEEQAAKAYITSNNIKTSFTTDSAKPNELKGLTISEDTNKTVYTLKEIKAPSGYIIVRSEFHFIVRPTVNDAGNITNVSMVLTNNSGEELTGSDIYTEATVDGNMMRITISNPPGAALPNTGGPGTNLIYLLGFLLTALAGAGLMMRKRKIAVR